MNLNMISSGFFKILKAMLFLLVVLGLQTDISFLQGENDVANPKEKIKGILLFSGSICCYLFYLVFIGKIDPNLPIETFFKFVEVEKVCCYTNVDAALIDTAMEKSNYLGIFVVLVDIMHRLFEAGALNLTVYAGCVEQLYLCAYKGSVNPANAGIMGLSAAELRQITYDSLSHLSTSELSQNLLMVLIHWASEMLLVPRLDDYGSGLGELLLELIRYAVWTSFYNV